MHKIDAQSTKIILLLQRDGRMPNTEIARLLGMAEATVRKRIKRLLEQKVIRVGAWVDTLKIGYEIYANIEIQVSLPHVERVAERLAKFPEVSYITICTGGYDIFAQAVFRSNKHMYEFLTKQLSRVPGVQRMATSHILRTVKREMPPPVTSGTEVDAYETRRSVRPPSETSRSMGLD
jgi:Lrp/AsnC family transcriptional regulator for asnA, asnC and gidA